MCASVYRRIAAVLSILTVCLLLISLLPMRTEADSAEYIFDEYGLLSAEETESIEASLEELQNTYGIIGFVITADNDTVGGSSDSDTVSYIEDFSDSNYFDEGGSIGLIINMESRYYYIDICGNTPLNVYTDSRQAQMKSAVEEKLYDGDYAGAVQAFADEAIRVAARASDDDRTGDYRDYESEVQGYSDQGITLTRILLSAAVAAVIAGIVLAVLLGKHREKKISRDANQYLAGGMHMFRHNDVLVSTYVTKVPRADQEHRGGGGGGTSIHSSGGGHAHSGGGGHF